MQPSMRTNRTPSIRRELVMIEVTEVVMVLEVKEVEVTETGEVTTRSSREAEMRPDNRMDSVVIIATRKAITSPIVPCSL